MKSYRVFLLGIAATVLVFALAGFSPKAQTKTFTVVERATSDHQTDVGAEGDSAGDILTFSNDIYDAENLEQIGYDSGYCIRTVPGAMYDCSWTVFLRGEGSLMVQGPSIDDADSILTVVGGTESYAGARGQMYFNDRGKQGKEFDLVFELIQ